MNRYVLGFQEIDRTACAAAGGKGANLGELSRIEGIQVPEGFCVTTGAYATIAAGDGKLGGLLDELARCTIEEREKIGEVSTTIRRAIESASIPDDVTEQVADYLTKLGDHDAYAVRSSATAEDLPTASFAGQQETYLNVIGPEAILKHISRCWASLFTDRAVIYRMQHGFDHRAVQLAVIVQKMVFPQTAGIMFTADPVTSNRNILSIDASFGLGEALVSGLVNPDIYKARNGEIIEKKISTKKLAMYALNDGGTSQQPIEPGRQNEQALSDEQILRLESIGRRIEEHFGSPQDIEWCMVDDIVYILQSRPITTLYPIPEAADREYHVYISVGHQQMMTAPIKPLGISFFQLSGGRPMYQAGGRLFVDIGRELASPAGREFLVNVLGKSDPLIQDALTTIVSRGDYAQPPQDDTTAPGPGKRDEGHPLARFQTTIEDDPAIVSRLIASTQASIEELKRDIQTKSGSDLFDFILEDFQKHRALSSGPENLSAIMTARNATLWVNDTMMEWLGEPNAADALSQSAPGNITSEMGLALLDVADAIRPYPEIIEYLQHVENDGFLEELGRFDGGRNVQDAFHAFLDRYGMRCVGEIDITRPRWSEKPTTLIPVVLGNIRNFEPNAGARKFEQGLRDAMNRERELLERLRQLEDGERKAEEAKRIIGIMRSFIGYREYPKYGIINRYFIYKQALLKEAERLVRTGVIHDLEDSYYLTFEELREAVRTSTLDYRIIAGRRAEYVLFDKLTPPRVMTSDGEIITGAYKRENLPAGAIVGLPVSSGIIEGRARVIFDIEDADLEDGDILVTPFTDPSWTPLFVSIKGLVTEVGGLMTHGAVIAREYGLPAVVGVEHATALISDGERIRVNGTDGYIEIL